MKCSTDTLKNLASFQARSLLTARSMLITSVDGKMTAVANRKIDEKKYARLLSKTLPRVITTEKENERMLEIVNELISKKRSPEEDALFLLVCRLVEDFEDKAYPISDAPPHTMLQFLMEQRGLRQKDIVPLFGSPGITSEVVNGKRAISKTQVRKLADFFDVSVELFL
jgi:HTH-type transcriptional regulator/antitoxin HigA